MPEILIHSIKHAALDSLKMLPFLIVAFVVLEYLEARLSDKSSDLMKKSGKAGPVLGALLGLVPQCGFSVIGSNFYAKRIITLGTLIAIYLSTSDEALLIMLGHPNRWKDILLVVALKFGIALVAGYIIDLVLRSRKGGESEECHHCHHHNDSCENEELIGEDHCCNHIGWQEIFKCAFKRTASVWLFLLAASFAIELAIESLGEESLQRFMLNDSVLQPLVTAVIGLIPNCAPSVILAQMYIEGAISLGSVISGLCTGAGVGLMVLFRVNRGVKSNLGILALLYSIGAISGVIIELVV